MSELKLREVKTVEIFLHLLMSLICCEIDPSNESPVRTETNNRSNSDTPTDKLKFPNHLTCMSLDHGRHKQP